MGQLKTSLSHLEFENEQLKKKTAKLEHENRSIESRLVREQLDNGDLTARLDDARNLLRDRGFESDVKLGSRRRDDGDQASDDDAEPRARTLSTGRAARQRRKPPFAQISSPVSVLPPLQDDESSAGGSRKGRAAKSSRSSPRLDDDLDQHSFNTGSLRWLPVADASPDSVIQIR